MCIPVIILFIIYLICICFILYIQYKMVQFLCHTLVKIAMKE